jgi:hypothetical protein
MCSARGAPGVTTTALLTAGCLTQGALVEADLAGGVLAGRFGLVRQPGLTTLAAAGTTAADGWRDHAQTVLDVPVLIGPDDPAVSEHLWSRAGQDLAVSLRVATADIVLDLGRLSASQGLQPLISEAALLVVMARPEIGELVTVARWLPRLRSMTTDVVVVLAQDGPFSRDDVANQLQVDVLAAVPTDRRTAAALMGLSPRPVALGRTDLGRAARSLAEAIATRITQVPVEVPPTTITRPAEVSG